MNWKALITPMDFSHVNVWGVLTTFFMAFFGGYLGVKFAIWRHKK